MTMTQQTSPVHSNFVSDARDELSHIDETACALEELGRLLVEDGGNLEPVGHLVYALAEVLIAHIRSASLLLDEHGAAIAVTHDRIHANANEDREVCHD
jgi:hypothetical protein